MMITNTVASVAYLQGMLPGLQEDKNSWSSPAKFEACACNNGTRPDQQTWAATVTVTHRCFVGKLDFVAGLIGHSALVKGHGQAAWPANAHHVTNDYGAAAGIRADMHAWSSYTTKESSFQPSVANCTARGKGPSSSPSLSHPPSKFLTLSDTRYARHLRKARSVEPYINHIVVACSMDGKCLH
jgi:hypothetical protein